MQNQIIAQEAEQITWLSRSAHVLNVSARLCCMRDRLLHSSLDTQHRCQILSQRPQDSICC